MQNTYNTSLTFPTSVIITRNILHTIVLHSFLYSIYIAVTVQHLSTTYLAILTPLTFRYFIYIFILTGCLASLVHMAIPGSQVP